jgi:hypothetical protein
LKPEISTKATKVLPEKFLTAIKYLLYII